MRIFLSLILSVVFATQGVALSCMRPDPVQSFHFANDIEEDVYILRGRVEFDENLLPEGMINRERNPDPITAYFKGHGLTLDGFTSRFERTVTLQPVCYGPWCGREVSNKDVLVFAKVVGDDIILESDPCGTNFFYDPTRKMLDQMQSCISGEACESSDAEW